MSNSELILPKADLILPPDPKWAPLYYTRAKSSINRADDIAEFARRFMTAERGARKGKPLELTAWQQWALGIFFEEKPDGTLRNRQGVAAIPRKNGKSMLGSAVALERLFTSDAGTQIYSAAKDREQAKVVFNYARRQVKASPVLSSVFKCYRDAIENKLTGGTYKAISSDAMSAQGLSVELAIADEIHGWTATQAEEFWAALTEASGDLPESMVLAITTAGSNLESLLGGLYEAGVELSQMDETPDDALAFVWWGADDEDDIFDVKTWYRANPNLAEGLYMEHELRGAFETAVKTGKLSRFRRYRLNQWTRSDGNDMYISLGQWNQIDKPGETIPKGSRITVGFDGSLTNDSTGFVGIDVKTGLMEVLASWHRDYSNPEWQVPRDEVLAARKRIFEEYDVALMWADDAFFQSDVMAWEREARGRVKRIPQSGSRMVPMTEQMKLDILSKEVSHGGSNELREHFMNAALAPNGRIYKNAQGRGSGKGKIDLAVCAILANGARNRLLRRGQAPGRKAIVLPN